MRGPRMAQGMRRRVRLNPCFMYRGANGALDAIHARGVRGGVDGAGGRLNAGNNQSPIIG
jgi:hypothetical protein